MQLKVDDVHYTYLSTEVLKGISFETKNGEILGILGKNGCGKTTLMKCINAHLKPDLGSITIDGISVSDIPRKELAKRLAIVSQHSNITFPFTVLETVMMGLYPNSEWMGAPSKKELEHVEDCMRATGILDFAERHVNELSGGERQRVMISRALVQDPDILLLDEPTLHLDVNYQFDLMGLITDLAKKKDLLVILVTHEIALAARYCDRIMMIENGVIAHSGSSKEVITPANLREVFNIEAKVEYNDDIKGLNVLMLGKYI